MVIGRNNGVVGLTGFSCKKMHGFLFVFCSLYYIFLFSYFGHIYWVVAWQCSTVYSFTLHNLCSALQIKLIKYTDF